MARQDSFDDCMRAWGVRRAIAQGLTGEVPVAPDPEQYAELHRAYYGTGPAPGWEDSTAPVLPDVRQ